MNYFTTRKQFLLPSFELNTKEQEKLDKFLLILDKSNGCYMECKDGYFAKEKK